MMGIARRVLALMIVGVLAMAGCAGQGQAPGSESPAPSRSGSAQPDPTKTGPHEPTEQASEPVRPDDFDARIAWRTVRHLAGTIGPRHATSPAFRRAVRWVGGRFEDYGLEVRRQPVPTPAGNSWGTEVPAGTSYNVIATPPGFDPTAPHLIVGAHLDTVPVAPGAEDNASGVGVLLAAAAAIERRETRLPVVLVAFGAEEPRGDGDAHHHYGSREYVAHLSGRERRAIRGMISLDRVGVGTEVPACAAIVDPDGPRWRGQVLRAGGRADVPTTPCLNSSSDHWSFARDGLPGVRLGGTSYAGYHSAADVPAVVDQEQLNRTGRVVLAWLAR